MSKERQQKRIAKKTKIVSAIIKDEAGNFKFALAKGDKVTIEYPPTWPSEQRKIVGEVRMVNEENGNVYVWCEPLFQNFGVNFKTADTHGVKVLMEVSSD